MRNRGKETIQPGDLLANAREVYRTARARRDGLLKTPGVTSEQLNEASLAVYAARITLNFLLPRSTRNLK